MSNTSDIKKMNRREFLAYMMAGSVSLLGVQATGVAVWFALPDYEKANTYILKTIPPKLSEDIPARIIAKNAQSKFRFWLSHTDQGLMAFALECPFRQMTQYAWVQNFENFICPSCGSKFTKEGVHVQGPASRHLDRHPLKIMTTTNKVYESDKSGNPIMVALNEIKEIHVNVGKLIRGNLLN